MEVFRVQFELRFIIIGRDIVKRNPLSVLHFLSVLHGDLFVERAQDADDEDVGGAVLIVQLLSHGKHALERSLDTRLFENFALDGDTDGLTVVDKAAGELPRL